MVHKLIELIPGAIGWTVWLWLWIRWHKTSREPPDPPLTSYKLYALKELGKPPPPPPKPTRWYQNRPGWFGPTANERLLDSMGKGYASAIRTATTDYHLKPEEAIRLARQAFAQDAITIDELERIIDKAIGEEHYGQA